MSAMSNWTRVLVVAAATVLAACGDRLVGPATSTPSTVRLDAVGTNGISALPAPPHGETTVSAVIGHHGGLLDAPTAGNRRRGYILTVPAGAVNKPTTFTMRVLRGERYEVELSALQGSQDVGDKLRLPVTLTISFGDSPAGRAPRSVKLYYLPENGGAAQAMPTLAVPVVGYLVGVLPHFSRYMIGID